MLTPNTTTDYKFGRQKITSTTKHSYLAGAGAVVVLPSSCTTCAAAAAKVHFALHSSKNSPASLARSLARSQVRPLCHDPQLKTYVQQPVVVVVGPRKGRSGRFARSLERPTDPLHLARANPIRWLVGSANICHH